jgi:hypothetical protein
MTITFDLQTWIFFYVKHQLDVLYNICKIIFKIHPWIKKSWSRQNKLHGMDGNYDQSKQLYKRINFSTDILIYYHSSMIKLQVLCKRQWRHKPPSPSPSFFKSFVLSRTPALYFLLWNLKKQFAICQNLSQKCHSFRLAGEIYKWCLPLQT